MFEIAIKHNKLHKKSIEKCHHEKMKRKKTNPNQPSNETHGFECIQTKCNQADRETALPMKLSVQF